MTPDAALSRKMYSIGVPATLSLALPSIQVSALNAILAVYSASYVLVLGAYFKLQTFLYLTGNEKGEDTYYVFNLTYLEHNTGKFPDYEELGDLHAVKEYMEKCNR